jgi:hypothetical protein
MATDRFHTKQPIDCGGLKINGTEIITSAGVIKGDIQATAGSIGEAELANLAVTEGKIGNLAVTEGKIGAGAVITAKIADGAVTSEKIDEGVLQTAQVTLTADEIVGTDEGCIGHTDGAVLVAAPGATKTLEFVSATLSYKYATAAYTGGGDDLVIRQGTTAVTAPIAKADLLADTADDIAYVNALSAADVKLTANSTLNLKGTALTQPGDAAGTLDVFITYRVHTISQLL